MIACTFTCTAAKGGDCLSLYRGDGLPIRGLRVYLYRGCPEIKKLHLEALCHSETIKVQQVSCESKSKSKGLNAMLKRIAFDESPDVTIHVDPRENYEKEVFDINLFVEEVGINRNFHAISNQFFRENGYFLRVSFEYNVKKGELSKGKIEESMIDGLHEMTAIAEMQNLLAYEIQYQLNDAYQGPRDELLTIFSQAVIKLEGECPDLHTAI